MKYRRFGKLDWEVSVLGFGAMRLPLLDNKPAHINEPLAIEMIRHSIDQGVNYIDTAHPYHEGKSEGLVGKALKDGYREKVKLATKQPSWFMQTADDFDKYFNEQLERLETDHIDFYLLHAMNRVFWPKVRDLGVIEWAEEKIKEGRIGHLGFSFHDDLETFKQVVDGYDNWAFCQIQYNFLDTEYQAGKEGLEYANDKGLAVVVMEPLRGGQITKEPPQSIAQLWESTPRQRTPADWALQWIWNHSEVPMLLSGMSEMLHVEENLASADQAQVGSLTEEELVIIDKVREEYTQLCPVPCTNCRYCMPCSHKVDIPFALTSYNEAIMYDNAARAQVFYQQLPADEQADNCQACFECEDQCPQGISIVDWLKKAHDLIGPKKN